MYKCTVHPCKKSTYRGKFDQSKQGFEKKYTFLLIGQNFIGIFFIYNDIVNHDINSRKFFAGVR